MCDSTFDRTLYTAHQRKKKLKKEQIPSASGPDDQKTPLPKGVLGREKGPHDSVRKLLNKIVSED